MPAVTAYVGLGSNLGDRLRCLQTAWRGLEKTPETQLLRLSRVYETTPVDMPYPTPSFLNQVVELQTKLVPEKLLDHLQALEAEGGRDRRPPAGPAPGRCLSRLIDLDLLLYGNACIATERLVIPHPRLHLRRFVLAPLCELSPQIVHPVSGLSMLDLLTRLDQTTPCQQVNQYQRSLD